jgi:alcohol dehydrogenase YqhD (iron-dependent ADH family)
MPVDASVIAPFERAISLYSRRVKQRVERVLITAAGATESLKRKGYFDRVLTLAELAEEL